MKLFFKSILATAFLTFFIPVVKADIIPIRPLFISKAKPKVTICFTIARKRDCEGFGICNFTASLSEGRMNNATASVYKDDHSNAIVFEINRSQGISTIAYDRYFKSGIFTMEDDAPIPSEITQALGISSTAILVQGRYPVLESSGVIKMIIPFR
jgi:hypothetical protein